MCFQTEHCVWYMSYVNVRYFSQRSRVRFPPGMHHITFATKCQIILFNVWILDCFGLNLTLYWRAMIMPRVWEASTLLLHLTPSVAAKFSPLPLPTSPSLPCLFWTSFHPSWREAGVLTTCNWCCFAFVLSFSSWYGGIFVCVCVCVCCFWWFFANKKLIWCPPRTGVAGTTLG